MTIPDIEILLKLSEIYGISINDILKADVTKIRFQKSIVFPGEEKRSKNVFVIGCGRWGTFIAWYLDKIGHKVSLYGRETSAKMQELLATGKNSYLSLTDSIHLVTTYEGINPADYIVISVGAQQLQSVATELAMNRADGKTVILCMKGIEIDTGRRLSQVVSDTLDHSHKGVTQEQLGEFELKHGQKKRYFLNSEKFTSNAQVAKIGEYFAYCIRENGLEFDVIMGLAYHGIAFSTSTACSLFNKYGVTVDYCFDRKVADIEVTAIVVIADLTNAEAKAQGLGTW